MSSHDAPTLLSIYFFGNYLRSDTHEKLDLGNNERPNVQLSVISLLTDYVNLIDIMSN